MAALLKTNWGTKKEVWLWAATFIPAVFLLNWLFYGKRYFTDWKLFLISTAAGFVITVPFQNGLVAVNMFFRKRYPSYNETAKRFLFCLSATFITTAFFLLVCIYGYQLIPLLAYPVTQNLVITILLVGIIFNIVSSSIHEAFYTFGKYRETLIETERLKKENLQQQFNSLKSQVNPHFLFNALSSLSALVEEDADKADDFLNDMSRVYRYMLRSNHQDWVTLQQELGFINSYYRLIKTRYSNSIILQVDTEEKYNDCMLPPLTLQLLMDNAIKHNTTGKEQPLQICIVTGTDNTLVVKNNLQKKHKSIHHHAVGLESLSAKFDLQNLLGFSVKETTDEFIVALPLSVNKFSEHE